MTTHRKTTAALAALALLSAVGLTACGSEGGGQGANSTLTVAMSGDTLSLDPTNCAPPVFCFPAYDSLVHVGADGTYEPALATNWEFVDDSHKVLRVALRTTAEFNDGTPLNADAVIASVERFLKSTGPNRSNAVPVSGVTKVDDTTVDIQYSTPVTYDYASFQISDQNGLGAITSLAASSNPKILETESAGIGPYKLDAANSQKGSQYTFVPNDKYFDQGAIKYEKIVLKPIANPASRLSAIESGQVEWAHNVPATFAKSVDTDTYDMTKGSNGGTTVLVLGDRASGPLADVRVRQAISMVIPREQIADSVFAGYATATTSLVPEGLQGYDAQSAGQTKVDVAGARKLMAEAGYADGFDLSVLDPSFFDPSNAVGQALISPLAEIGIDVKLTPDDSDPGVVVQKMFSKKYEAVVFSKQGSSTYGTTRIDLSPGGYLNPFGLPGDEKLDEAIDAAALAATPAEQAKSEQKATAIMDGLYWAVPIVAATSLQVTTQAVDNVPDSYVTRDLNPFGPVADKAWAQAGE